MAHDAAGRSRAAGPPPGPRRPDRRCVDPATIGGSDDAAGLHAGGDVGIAHLPVSAEDAGLVFNGHRFCVMPAASRDALRAHLRAVRSDMRRDSQ
ncbi:SptB protein [Lysobacter enzymogenes]|uniref:SptB protein n=1 Tax=Lysobacter enzymogenes TaxID=69 RepID=A0A0S2DKY7_LYSEN|nr:SptB protein [Lysobacter enzymogenes]